MIFQTVKKSWVRAILAGSLLTLPIFANAELPLNNTVVSQTNRQVPSDESLDKLIKIQRIDKTSMDLKQIEQITLKKFYVNNSSLWHDKSLTAEQNSKIRTLMQNFIHDSIQDLNSTEFKYLMTQAYKDIAKDTYNQSEVNAMIDFYGSAIGQKIIDKDPIFTAAVLQKTSIISQQFQQKIISEKLPALVKQIEKITGKPISQ